MKRNCLVITLLLLVVLIIPLACQRAPAEFQLNSLEIAPSEVTPGQTVNVSAQVKNIGGVEGSYEVTLTINEVKSQTKEVKVRPGKTEAVSFTAAGDKPGTYNVTLNDQSGIFRVLKPAQFTISNLIVTPHVVEAGQAVTITLDVTNTGEVEGSHSATLMANGSQVEKKELVVTPGTTATLTLSFSEKNTGSYNIKVGELSGLVVVTETGNALAELGTAYPELCRELLRLPDLEGLDDKDKKAMEDIAYLALNPKNRQAFESMLNEGIKDKRKYCTPLQALVWIAYDREFTAYDVPSNYFLSKLISDAWENTTASKNYTSDRWKSFDEVVDRLNSPKLIATYMDRNIHYDWEKLGRLDSYWQSPIETFNRKKGICQDKARFALYLLLQNGYPYAVMFRAGKLTGFPNGHVVCLYRKDSKYYTNDSADTTVIKGPFSTLDAVADATYPSWEEYHIIPTTMFPRGF